MAEALKLFIEMKWSVEIVGNKPQLPRQAQFTVAYSEEQVKPRSKQVFYNL